MNAPILQRKQRWLNFYDRSQPKSHIFLIRYAPELGPKPWPNPDVKHQRLEWIWRNYEWHLQRMDWLDDDTIPCLDMITGTELFAEAFGCPVHRPADNMPFALPLAQDAAAAEKLAIPTVGCAPVGVGLRDGRRIVSPRRPGGALPPGGFAISDGCSCPDLGEADLLPGAGRSPRSGADPGGEDQNPAICLPR